MFFCNGGPQNVAEKFPTSLMMADELDPDRLMIERIRAGEDDAWHDMIARYEGRLVAFAETRVGDRVAAEDIVQETLVGFLTSLPNYDGGRPLESYLFSICAYKLTDFLRRRGRRPAISLSAADSDRSGELPGRARPASTIARSVERKALEEDALRTAMSEQIERWKERGDWQKLKCLELLIVRGDSNKEVAAELEISEQQVANYKSDFQIRLRTVLKRMELDESVFPELTRDA
jgi:RNA polymerase sigma-70 factor, ECF subfamily